MDAAGIREQRIGRLEHPQLAPLVRSDVVHRPRPCLFPRGSPGRKVSLQNPFVERFDDHTQWVLDTGGCRQLGLVLLAGAGGDAVDHGGDPGDVLFDPATQLGVNGIRKIQDHTPGDEAVVGQDTMAMDPASVRAEGRCIDRNP